MRGRVEFFQDNNLEWRWHLIAPNNKIIADSGEGYQRRRAAEKSFNEYIGYTPIGEKILAGLLLLALPLLFLTTYGLVHGDHSSNVEAPQACVQPKPSPKPNPAPTTATPAETSPEMNLDPTWEGK